MKIFETNYRIITYGKCGFDVEFRWWWFPFWIAYDRYFSSVEEAETYARRRKNKVVKYL